MAEMTVELVAVEQRLWSGSATLVSAQTTEGEIGIMPGHEPVLGQLIEGGTVSITSVDGERIVAAVHGGFLSVHCDDGDDPCRVRGHGTGHRRRGSQGCLGRELGRPRSDCGRQGSAPGRRARVSYSSKAATGADEQ